MKLFTKALVVALVVSCHLPLASATMIDEISVDSVDTVFGLSPSPGVLTIYQNGVGLVLERSDNTQQTLPSVSFSLQTFLQADLSAAGQAIADFAGGTITITNNIGTLLTADIGAFTVEETLNLPFTLVIGSGDFTVTGGSLDGDFGPNGVIFDITWELDSNIDDFSQDFTAESDVTLTPEPATMILLGAGGLFAAKRRCRR
ncbi:MAG: PEP-CTERM sorting domain-containing protein [Deltaproteobacteria bacterium]|nr:PEP-CTERM sorting domain-containing protein [Deltaproteobacteria bacterium]